jgi:hypothetical protein
MSFIQKLLSIGGEPLSSCSVTVNVTEFEGHGTLANELWDLLLQKNGFYAFESALHVFPAAPLEDQMTLSRWNSYGLWRHEYQELVERMLFFAEDAFGNQFCLHDGQVCLFDAETGGLERKGRTLDEWAKLLLEDYKVLTGHPLLHEWQIRNGALPIGKRLIPKMPFVLGGQYAIENLYAIEAVSGMKARGNLARQIKNLPEGAEVQFQIIDCNGANCE